jgi:hypothetical protein
LRVDNAAGVGLDDQFIRTMASWDHPLSVQRTVVFSVGRFRWQLWYHRDWKGANGPTFRTRGFIVVTPPRCRIPRERSPCRAHVDVVKGAEATWNSNNSAAPTRGQIYVCGLHDDLCSDGLLNRSFDLP